MRTVRAQLQAAAGIFPNSFFSTIYNSVLLVLQDIYIRTKQGYLNLKYTVYN